MIDEELAIRLLDQASQDAVEQLVVGAIVGRDDEVLLLRRPENDFMGGIYELPSGKLEHGESLTDAVCREVREETGLIVCEIGEYVGSFNYASGSGRLTRQLSFAVVVESTATICLSEHDDYKWVNLASELPVTEDVSNVLRTYRDNVWRQA